MGFPLGFASPDDDRFTAPGVEAAATLKANATEYLSKEQSWAVPSSRGAALPTNTKGGNTLPTSGGGIPALPTSSKGGAIGGLIGGSSAGVRSAFQSASETSLSGGKLSDARDSDEAIPYTNEKAPTPGPTSSPDEWANPWAPPKGVRIGGGRSAAPAFTSKSSNPAAAPAPADDSSVGLIALAVLAAAALLLT